jgi:hypothetical protein
MDGRIRSVEKSNNIFGSGTCDLPACSIVPQPSTPPRTPTKLCDLPNFVVNQSKFATELSICSTVFTILHEWLRYGTICGELLKLNVEDITNFVACFIAK